MMKMNAIQFAAGLSVDLNDEIVELDNLIGEAKMDESKIDEVIRVYSHLNSFLQGIEYILDYFEEDEEREQMKELCSKRWVDDLKRLWAPIMMLKYSRDLKESVRIVTCCHTKAPDDYEVTVGNGETKHFDSWDDVRDYLRSLKK